MTEDDISREMFLAARDDPRMEVLSWQGVSGKAYFTSDVQLRLPNGDRVVPDLIVNCVGTVWIIEIKPTHEESAADEEKLIRLGNSLPSGVILAQITSRTGMDVSGSRLVLAVAYAGSAEIASCVPWILHIDWAEAERRMVAGSLCDVLLAS